MISTESCSDSDTDLSIDSDYNSGGSDHSSPFPAAAVLVPQSPSVVLYYVVVPPGYHLEFTSIEPSFTELAPVKSSTEKPASNELHFTKTTASQGITFQRRLIKWSLPPPPVRAANLPGWSPTPYGLEKYWQFAFAWFFRPYLDVRDHLWTMKPVELPPVSVEWPWHSFSYLAKVHFLCPVAKHPGWTSKKGLVNFWFRIRRQDEETVCEVLFKPYGQQCKKCNNGTSAQQYPFLPALWYPEFVEAAVRSLSILIGQLYYGCSQAAEGRSWGADPLFLRKNRPSKNKPIMSHDSNRCQACIESLCVINNSAMLTSV